ncbi:glucan biosynthesis protein [Amorphus orientalis]|uniref:Glucans biosynthesis protein n=1 Tax=Amorphus orientalis TaxID=649198 RepID=A0AAE3VL81_9HYPH|nr:glucan biosynthesis protein [Amorphus orientalis]MDQ0314047.1 glucans biosynthesis protein [Amorphus orientalis]
MMDRTDGLRMDRRQMLTGAASLLAALGLPALATAARAQGGLPMEAAQPYSFDALRTRARRLASSPYVAPPVPHSELLETVDFDAYQTITFKPSMTVEETPDPVRLFHLGRYFKTPVRLYLVEGDREREIAYHHDAFGYDDPDLEAKLPDDLGYAGFRLMNPDGRTDFLAFLGSSYFRSSGPEGQYGLSARGLAIDTGLSRPEEFPRFSAFWLHAGAEGEPFVIDALLESESVTGAYRFKVSTPDAILMDVDAYLYVRKDVERLGVAPLTSMFWYSEANRHQATDWRPEVHDSDGLALWTGSGERIWRPLNNPKVVRTSTFTDADPKGFGLLQRDRVFGHYEDDGAFYDKRPGLWVEPLSDWGEGEVQLVEIPTDDEIYDNIAAYWKPAQPVRSGDALHFAYRLHWVSKEPYPPEPVAHVVATRIGRAGVPGQERSDGKKFAIDFTGGPLDGMEQRFDIDAVVDASRGEVSGSYVVKVVGTDRWRAVFDLEASGSDPVELRCYLKLGDQVLTETWMYQYLPFDFAG